MDFFGSLGASFKFIGCEVEKSNDFSRGANTNDKITKTFHITAKTLQEPTLIEG